MILPNICCGICQAGARYARANNKLIGSHYDLWQFTWFIMEVYANNLYGLTMSNKMQVGNFNKFS